MSLITSLALAKRLGVSHPAVLEWARKNNIPAIRDSRNRLVFSLNTVLASMIFYGSVAEVDHELAGGVE